MNRGVNRQPTFYTDTDRVEFGHCLAEIHEMFGVEVLAYCLMGNHYHLLLRTPNGGLSRAMQRLGLVYTRHTNDRLGRDGPLFRGRFHSILVTSDDYLMRAARYVHRNPLAIRGVDSPADYRWTSYRAYLGRRAVAPFLNTDLVLGLFGHDRSHLAAHTEGASAPFQGSADDLVPIVEYTLAADDLDHGSDDTRRPSARTILVHLAARLGADPVRSEIVRHLAFPSQRAEQVAIERARTSAVDPAIVRVVSTIAAELGLPSARVTRGWR